MSTLVIAVKTGRAVADLTSKLVKDATAPKPGIRGLADFLKAVAGGLEPASVDVHTASASPVAASGTITITFANLADTDALVIAGVTLAAATSGNGTTTFTIGANLAAATTNLTACINANTTLSQFFTATGNTATGVVTLTCKVKGAIGNLIGFSSADNAFAFSGSGYLAGGTGGPLGTVTTYAAGG